MPQKQKKSDVLYIGIDLGTSRSAVVASNGSRQWIESYVGWPKDFIAQKLLEKPILFGEEARTHRLSVDLFRPLNHGVVRDGTLRDEEAIRALIHHLIELAAPDKGQEVYAAIGVPAQALKVNKLAIRDAVKAYADALMVVSEPFAVAYGISALNNAMVIDIGAGTSDFCIMHGTMPGEDDQRSLNLAGDYVDQQLYERLVDKYPKAKFSELMVRGFKEQHGFVGENRRRVKVNVPVEGVATPHEITEELRKSCESLVPSLAETLMDLIARYEPDFQDQVKKNIFIAGGGSQIKGLAAALEGALEDYGVFKVRTVGEPLFAGAEGALALARDMPEEYWENM